MQDDRATLRRELLDTLARAIDETRALLDENQLGDVLAQLEDVRARLGANEDLSQAYRESLSFNIRALRELEHSEEEHWPYLDLLREVSDLIGRV